jgi:hypothetical protein
MLKMKNKVKTAKSNYAERVGSLRSRELHKGKQSCTEKLITFRVAWIRMFHPATSAVAP